jgi:hydrogenase maturation protease
MNEWEWSLLEDKASVDRVEVDGVALRVGNRVRLHPKEGGDILDLALRGQVAIIESIEEDYEGGKHVCVVLEDDPGRDLGMMRQPGHRFFFNVAEVEPLPDAGTGTAADAKPKPVEREILVAGIGNIFLGDDGFGVAVVRRLLERNLPGQVRIVDFGIRGLDLAYALQDGYETTILIDALPHGQSPGTVSVVEPNRTEITGVSGNCVDQGNFVEPHSMHPLKVLRMAYAMGAPLKRVLLVGCEPAFLGGDEGYLGLSDAVQPAIEEAVKVTEALIRRTLEA